jgi:hypothetical protein
MSEQAGGSRTAPRRSRPHMPAGYGIPATEEGMLPWSHVEERLEQAKNFWVITASTEGKPHAIPIWGAWADNRVFFEGGSDTRWARNFAANPQVVVHLESGDDVVIIHGRVEELSKPPRWLFDQIDASYARKYSGYKPSDNLKGPDDEPYPEGGLYSVRPRVVLAWSKFPTDPTRFHFDET